MDKITVEEWRDFFTPYVRNITFAIERGDSDWLIQEATELINLAKMLDKLTSE